MNWGARDRVPFGRLAAIQNGTGDAVLLLHGVGLRAEAWASHRDYRSLEFAVTAPDLPGHGESALPENARFLADFTDLIAAAITEPMLYTRGSRDLQLRPTSVHGRVELRRARLRVRTIR